MSLNKIKIGILGCASIAKRHVIPNMIKSGKYDLKYIASRNINKAKNFTKIFGGEPVEGYEQLLNKNDVEAIYIPLPTGMHFKWIMASLEANKHVFVEKSITTEYHEVEKIIEVASKRELCVFENFMFPFHSQIDYVKNKILDGLIGDIKLLRSSFGFPIFDRSTNIRYNKKLGGGALFDAGAYTLLASQVFLGSNQKVISYTNDYSDFDVDFHGSILLINQNNIPSQLAFGFNNYYQNNIELWGTKGKIFLERAFTAPPDYNPKLIFDIDNKREELILPSDNHFINILNKFHECIRNKNFSFQFEQIRSQSFLMKNVRLKLSN